MPVSLRSNDHKVVCSLVIHFAFCIIFLFYLRTWNGINYLWQGEFRWAGHQAVGFVCVCLCVCLNFALSGRRLIVFEGDCSDTSLIFLSVMPRTRICYQSSSIFLLVFLIFRWKFEANIDCELALNWSRRKNCIKRQKNTKTSLLQVNKEVPFLAQKIY